MEEVYFQDVAVGDRFISPGRTIAEADLVNFAGVSGDFSELHTNEEFARTTAFGGRIAHGLLTLAVATGLLSRVPRLPLFGAQVIALAQMRKVRFRAPVKPGDTIHAELVIRRKRRMVGQARGLISATASIKNQRQREVLTVNFDVVIRTRPQRSRTERFPPGASLRLRRSNLHTPARARVERGVPQNRIASPAPSRLK